MGASVLVLALLVAYANALLNVSNALGSNMVLQREPLQANIWGWVDEKSNVTVTFNGKMIAAVIVDFRAANTKIWKVALPATKAGGPYSIAVSSTSGEKLALQNILFGDVYLCGGQSNMQFTVSQGFNATEEIALADKYPNIRAFSVGEETTSLTPLSNLAKIQLPWSVSTSKVIGGPDWSYMSAVCWYFGRDLHDRLGGQVPIGLISSNWGGTYVQAWSSPEALAKCAPKKSVADPNPNTPSVLWNAMIVPFLPGVIRGALWYQGEANVGADVAYACMFPEMITDWRAQFGTGYEFPFFFVQLAPWTGGNSQDSVNVALLRQAQLNATKLPAVGYASAIDRGDATSPFGSIHPRDKQTVGQRLVDAAVNIAYGDKTVVWEGPTFAGARAVSDHKAITVSVDFLTHGRPGLLLRPAACPAGQSTAVQCKNFELLLSDGKWYDADATLASNPNQVTVTLTNTTSNAKAIRYAWSIWPLTTIFSTEGLPAIPFQYTF